MSIDTEGYIPQEEQEKIKRDSLENKETELGDSAKVAINAEEGMLAIIKKGEQPEAVRRHLMECCRYLSKDTDLKSIELAEDFANKLKLAGEEDEAQELFDKIKSVRAEQEK